MTAKPEILFIEHIEADPETGEPRIAGRRYSVAFLSTFIDKPEWPVDRIARNYQLTPAQIYAAWSYYYDHREAIDRAMREAEKRIEEIATPTSDLPGYEEFMAKRGK